MRAAKRNRSTRKVGHSRGVPVRAAAALARKYSLSHIVVFTADKQTRTRVLYWARNDQGAMQCATFCAKLAESLGWESVWDWDCSSVRRLKERIKELERALAEIVDAEPGSDPVEIARRAGKFPDES